MLYIICHMSHCVTYDIIGCQTVTSKINAGLYEKCGASSGTLMKGGHKGGTLRGTLKRGGHQVGH